jgi:hypothetical protein
MDEGIHRHCAGGNRCLWRALGVMLCVGTLLLPLSSAARMYQWVDPARGSAQLSGTPPSWYRSSQGGPRVRVFHNGNLIDDTAIALPRTQARELRDAAFAEYQQRQQEEALRQLERTALKEQRRRDEAQRLAVQRELAARAPAAPVAEAPTSKVLAVPDDPQAITAETVERLKALLGEFDRQGGDLQQ